MSARNGYDCRAVDDLRQLFELPLQPLEVRHSRINCLRRFDVDVSLWARLSVAVILVRAVRTNHFPLSDAELRPLLEQPALSLTVAGWKCEMRQPDATAREERNRERAVPLCRWF